MGINVFKVFFRYLKIHLRRGINVFKVVVDGSTNSRASSKSTTRKETRHLKRSSESVSAPESDSIVNPCLKSRMIRDASHSDHLKQSFANKRYRNERGWVGFKSGVYSGNHFPENVPFYDPAPSPHDRDHDHDLPFSPPQRLVYPPPLSTSTEPSSPHDK